jgi:hypothetical protein
MAHELAFQVLDRRSDGTPGVKRECHSVDFLIDGKSLLQALASISGSHGDFAGCFSRGVPQINAQRFQEFLGRTGPSLDAGRLLLYVCPECGDLGCGAYTARVERTESGFSWSDFAFENGYEAARLLPSLGPYHFHRVQYEDVLFRACAV